MVEFVGDLEWGVLGWEVLLRLGVGAESVEGVEGEDLLGEDMAELACCLMSDVFERGKGYAFGDFKVQAGDGLVGDAAGIDELEVAEVGGDVESEAVGGDSAGDVYADGSDFAFAGRAGLVLVLVLVLVEAAPDARESGDTTGANAIDAAETDEGFFHHANEVDGTETAAAGVLERAEIEDGVADQLAVAVVGDVASSIDFVQGDAAALEEFVGGEDVGAAGVAAEGEYGRMFEKKECVFNEPFETEGGYFGLQTESFVVGDAAEIKVLNHGTFHCMDAGAGQRCGAGSKIPAKFERTRRKTRSQRRLTTAAMGNPEVAMVIWVRSMLMITPARTVRARGT